MNRRTNDPSAPHGAPDDATNYADMDDAAYRATITPILAAIRAIPRDELPDGPDRDALMRLAEMGFIGNVYTPIGANYHNIWWERMLPWVDARERVSDWLAARHRALAETGELPSATPDGRDGTR